ncbi:MAG: hypothetical protein ACRDKY_10380 [Solirubrobacteraceae bacterium]
MSARPRATRASAPAAVIAWGLIVASIAVLYFFVPAALAGGLLAAFVAQRAHSGVARNVAVLVVLVAVVSLILGGFEGSIDGGLDDPAD